MTASAPPRRRVALSLTEEEHAQLVAAAHPLPLARWARYAVLHLATAIDAATRTAQDCAGNPPPYVDSPEPSQAPPAPTGKASAPVNTPPPALDLGTGSGAGSGPVWPRAFQAVRGSV